jgi:4-hydroxy-tetrahydrodipicolinate synthase
VSDIEARMRTPFTGCGTALVTPFTTAGAIDQTALRRLVRRQVDAGVHFLVPCGTTGESPTLSTAERRRVVEVTPYYNKPTPEGLYQHYRAIAGATPLPIIVYNVPGRTGCNVDPATLARLSSIPTIVGVKEASGNMMQICDVCERLPPDFIVLSGDDALALPSMAVGARGVISVASNEVPAQMARLVEAAERNDFAAAREIHTRFLPLMAVNFAEANPIPVKAALAMMGLIEEAYRLPMVPPRADVRERIGRVLGALGLLAVEAAGA